MKSYLKLVKKLVNKKKFLFKHFSFFLLIIGFVFFLALSINKKTVANAASNNYLCLVNIPTIPPFPTIPSKPTIPQMPTFPVDIEWQWCGCDHNGCCKPTKTPCPTQSITQTPVPTMPEVTRVPSVIPTPTSTNNGESSDGGSNGDGGSSSSSDGGSSDSNDGGGGEILQGIMVTAAPGQVLGEYDTFNPLLFGIKNTKPRVLGAKIKKLPKTASSDNSGVYSDNQIVNDFYIFIPKLGLSKPISQGQVFNDQVLIGTPNEVLVFQNNPHVFYGHNNNELFGQLYKLTLSDYIYLTRNGTTKTYKVNSMSRVSENYTKTLTNDDNDQQITLFTCDHFDSSLRVIVKAVEI